VLAAVHDLVYASVPVPGYFSKLLFPNSTRSQRLRKLRAIRVWVIAGGTIVAFVVGFLYLVYTQLYR
jgi:hypothetical protein